jgi:hypothetical protein
MATALTAGMAVLFASCGTVLYPERRGQPAGRLDTGVVLLDGIGLLVFLVPGVVAFVVDFSTGAIYLPPEQAKLPPAVETELRKIHVNPAELTPERVAAIVREQTGDAFTLRPGEYRATRIERLDQFSPQVVAELQASAAATQVIFRASAE